MWRTIELDQQTTGGRLNERCIESTGELARVDERPGVVAEMTLQGPLVSAKKRGVTRRKSVIMAVLAREQKLQPGFPQPFTSMSGLRIEWFAALQSIA